MKMEAIIICIGIGSIVGFFIGGPIGLFYGSCVTLGILVVTNEIINDFSILFHSKPSSKIDKIFNLKEQIRKLP